MKKIFYIFLFIIYSFNCLSQEDNKINKSFIHTNLFTGFCSVGSMIGTSDGGFAYKLFVSGICSISGSKQTKYKIVCLACFGYKNNCDCKLDCDTIGGSFLVKTNRLGAIEWMKTIFAIPYGKSFKNISGSGTACYNSLKQTKDDGFICSTFGRICKLDKLGNLQWDLYFDRDSITGISKTGFLLGACVTDIIECRDGSYVALLDASFSLMKISKDGKPLWLKSTVFNEFDPMYFNYYPDQLRAIEKTDSIEIYNYKRGGGIYVPTYNVYQTDDGGYIAVGKNNYRCKSFITDYTDSNKTFYITKEFPGTGKKHEVIVVPHPKKIYGIRKYPLGENEKQAFIRQGTTVVVKTDKNGKVIWEKQFGAYSWSESMASSSGSDIIKLSNEKWLVRIKDCGITGYENDGTPNWSGAFSRFFYINDNGDILQEKKMNSMDCDPVSMTLAPDSGYFLFEQGMVTKTNNDLKIQWQQGYGGRAIDQGLIHAVTSDTGVICTEEGILYKFDKYGNQPFPYITLDKIDNDTTTVHFYFKKNGKENYGFEIEKLGGKEIKRVYCLEASLEKRRSDAMFQHEKYYTKYPKELKNMMPMNPGENSKQEPDSWVFDLNNREHINAIIIDTRIINSPNGDLFPDSKKEIIGKRVNCIAIPALWGYNEVIIKYPEPGIYVYKLINISNNAIVLEGRFEIKIKDLIKKEK